MITAPALPGYSFNPKDIGTADALSIVLRHSFFQALAKLEGLPDRVVTAEIVKDGSKEEINCLGMPAPEQLPIKVQHWCRHNASEVYDLDENCPDPYKAYEKWCASVFCYDIKGKTEYLQAMQILAAMGVQHDYVVCLHCCVELHTFGRAVTF
jgi:hypothetical protein